MRYPERLDDDGPSPRAHWFTKCRVCAWEEDEFHNFQDECSVSTCPECNSDDIQDINEVF